MPTDTLDDELIPPLTAPTPTKKRRGEWVTLREFASRLRWIDGRPLSDIIEPYRWRIFERFLDERDEANRLRYNLALCGRAKKNWKSADLILAAMFALVANDSPGGNQCYLLANDEGQAGDDLSLAKKLVAANKRLDKLLLVQKRLIKRRDGLGFLEILPAQDVVGQHGKTARFIGWDEIHGYKTWDILEALQPDPTRLDAQQWITSYASLFHKPGVPLFDMLLGGKTNRDPRMLLSWYAADWTTDADFTESDPETRANPSRSTWADQGYLDQQKARLPAHKYRRLHLNLPGLPEGSAYTAEMVMEAIDRGVAVRPPESGVGYIAFVDMSGGSNDDATIAIGHKDADNQAVVDLVMNQGPPCPFDPRAAVERFAATLKTYSVARVVGDNYAGQTFKVDFERLGITYQVSESTASELYEGMEPLLNGRRVVLLDVPTLEQELLGLIWRGAKITHPNGEHDDWANAVAGVVNLVAGKSNPSAAMVTSVTRSTVPTPEEMVATGPSTLSSYAHPHERHEATGLAGMSSRKRRAWGGN